MPTTPPRVLFLGLDALDADLVLQWAEEGVLPTFGSLIQQGSFGPTTNPPGLYVGAVWPSFFTGVSPTRHGRYCFKQIIPGTYHIERFRPTALRNQPFWKALGEAGKRVAVVDVPKSPLVENLNGIQLQDWSTHDPEIHCSPQSWPPELASDITSRYGVDPVGDCNHIDRSAEGIARFRDQLQERITSKVTFCKELLEQEDWDLFLAVFAESHCVGHQLWTVHDPSHVAHDPALAEAVGDPLRDVYVALDSAVGELLQSAGPSTRVIVLASHGMGPHYDATFMLGHILQRLDPRPVGIRLKIARQFRRYRRAFLQRVLRLPQPPLPLPLDHRRFFSVPNNDVHGGIRINLAGREPNGKVQPGREYDEVFDELRSALCELKNDDTGEKVVLDVVRASGLYPGENLDDLPDFFVEWNRDSPITNVSSPRFGSISQKFDGVRTGDHKPNGFFWAMGPDVPKAQRVEGVSVMDFAPTIAALLEMPTEEFDGKPIAAVATTG